MMALAPAFVRVVSHGGVFRMAVTGVHRGVPVGDEPFRQRGVEFGLRTVQPVAQTFRIQFLGQTRQGVLAAYAL